MAALLCVVAFLAFAARDGRSKQIATPSGPANPAHALETLSPDGQARLRAILAAATLAELHRPNFSRYRSSVAEFYRSVDDRLAWIAHSQPTPQALAMIRVLENADAEGLVPDDYDGPRWASRMAAIENASQAPEAELIPFDVALTVSAMRYISDLDIGRANPGLFHSGLDIEQNRYDLAQFLAARIIHAPDIRPALDEVAPPLPIYRREIEALHKYQKWAREYHGRPLPVPRKTVHPGNSYRATRQLAGLLRLLGDLPPGATIDPSETIYQGSLVDAVKHFQRRHGIDADGVLGRETFRELNTPLGHRILQLRLALERLRWLPRRLDSPPIIVNIPEFRLHVIGAGQKQVLAMKVVVGKAYGHQTPVFASRMRSVIFRPYWKVPLSIQQEELVPDIRRDPDYLDKHDYEVVDHRGRVVSDGEVNADILEGLASGTLFARQKPGPKDSLGLIRFDLPNSYDVYLHATPATALFSRSRRDFSHGCIRVEKPVALAAWALRNNPGWTPDRIREAMNGDRTFQVNLATPIPVLIVYGTAVVAENGEARFFRDIYGLDAELEMTLATGRLYREEAESNPRR